MSVKVLFSVAMNDESISFSTIEQIENNDLRETLWYQLLKWSQSMRELSIRHIIGQETSDEAGRMAQITFACPNPPQNFEAVL